MGRTKNIIIFIITLFLALTLKTKMDNYRIETSYVSGWVLLISILILSLYSKRKFLMLIGLHVSKFRKSHILWGYLALIIFLFHISFENPTGIFENLIAYIFILISITGILGSIITKKLSKNLSILSKEYLYEKIPDYRSKTLKQFEEIANKSNNNLNPELLESLYSYFANSKNIINSFLIKDRPKDKILRELYILADTNSKNLAEQLIELVKMKSEIDQSYYQQFILRYWTILHSSMIGSFFILIVLHIFIVYSFKLR